MDSNQPRAHVSYYKRSLLDAKKLPNESILRARIKGVKSKAFGPPPLLYIPCLDPE